MGQHDMLTTVNYYDDPGDGSPPTPVYVGSNQVTNERPMIATAVAVTDVTGSESSFTLDSHGFQFHGHTTSQSDGFHDDDALRARYYPECELLVKEITGASRVVAFDHKVRRGPSSWHKLGENNTESRGPLHRAHVDQSYDGALARMHEQFAADEDVGGLLQRRWQIVNIWRPIKTVYKDPLAFADATSVADADLVPASIVYARTGRRRESWTVKPSAGHRWFFKYAQRPDEVVLIKCFDSDASVAARRVPHCAVEDAEHVDGECRESVEVRCLVLF
ncbi:hypothetical protein B0T26DRAFT_844858 [Lasiosphaeria miniovina]|uniref:Uncharacterized protein n=1 Tax=Lasiosphaeria miniovina TaxID=1954250 RepID=A0AA40BHV5_9PEZI|nr:uncharacterized protein B0T26DRAFT_844858 [Lasiosphaeria miniovina]KAK0734518.1 hypothetical protein B0T26DRAFT_844858 [Lasiosphaeria miniovina]